MPKPFKARCGRAIEYTVRAVEDGDMSDGSTLWRFEHAEGDADADAEWEPGLPSLSGPQLQAFAMWLVSADPPGIASPHHPTMAHLDA